MFALLGMRNLSSFVGEAFAASLIKVTDGMFRKNPHQDGYPDLLLMDRSGESLWDSLRGQAGDKKPFSPFATGGLEVKATCGSVPSPEQCRRAQKQRPDLGDQRIELLKGYDWKAHHRDTNNLLGIVWDFIDEVPSIVAVFYSDSLDYGDWGKIVTPTEGGGRTTSVSIMTRPGIKKMYDGWVVVIDDRRYSGFFNHYNQGTSMPASQATSGAFRGRR